MAVGFRSKRSTYFHRVDVTKLDTLDAVTGVPVVITICGRQLPRREGFYGYWPRRAPIVDRIYVRRYCTRCARIHRAEEGTHA